MTTIAIRKNVSLSTTVNGTPRPQLEIRFADHEVRGLDRAGCRELRAQLFEHAAKAIRLTPALERWSIEVLRWSDERGAVAVELITGSDTEADAALEMLRKVAE